jgi:hypothetical protein
LRELSVEASMAAASVEIYRNGGVGRVEVEVAVAVAVAVRARARGPAQMARRTIMVVGGGSRRRLPASSGGSSSDFKMFEIAATTARAHAKATFCGTGSRGRA